MAQNLVSIIIPVYNVEKYLEECINSILIQSYKNIELILINDGSTDGSRDIIEKFAESDSRIAFIDNENKGVGASRNDGIKTAKGDYVIFIDSDDYVDSDLVSNLLSFIGDNDICIYDAVSFEDSSKEFDTNKYFNGLSAENLSRAIADDTHREFLFYYISPCLKIFRRDYLIKNNLLFPEGTYGEDVIFWAKCILATDKILYREYIGYFRRYRAGSIMTSKSVKNLKDRVDSIAELLSISEGHKNMQIKTLSYALEIWFEAYEINKKELNNYTQDIYKGINLKYYFKNLNPRIEMKLRYSICQRGSSTIVSLYKFLFYSVYLKLKRLFR